MKYKPEYVGLVPENSVSLVLLIVQVEVTDLIARVCLVVLNSAWC